MLRMNKKADISITVLVLGVVAVCFLTIFSFINSSNSVDESFLGIGLIETMNSFVIENDFYERTDFEGEYGETFERGKVVVTIIEEKIEGTYTEDGKTLVKIIHRK
tara:strand:- start:411 stop:728 length:318 start_codon:yes stop_codon:yes gene_type:complete